MRVLIWLLCLSLGAAVTGPALGTSETPSDEWPTLQSDAGRTGFRGSINGPGTGEIIWRFQTGDLGIKQSPGVANGRVYIGAGDRNFYALDAATGDLVWNHETTEEATSSGVIAQETVYFHAGDGYLYALDANDGELRWRFAVNRHSRSTPTIVDGTLYFGSFDGTLYAIDSDRGELRWTFVADAPLGKGTGRAITGSPLAFQGMVFFGTSNRQFFSVDLMTGELKWKIRVDGLVPSSAVTDGKRVFVSSDLGTVYALEPADGSVAWTQGTTLEAWAGISVRNGVIYRLGLDGLFALDAETGALRWHYANTTGGGSYPAVSETTVFISDSDGTITALAADDGHVEWSRVIAAFLSETSPVVVNGMLYVGSEQYRVFALDAGAGMDPLPSAYPPPENNERKSPSPTLLMSLLAIFVVLLSRLQGERGRRHS